MVEELARKERTLAGADRHAAAGPGELPRDPEDDVDRDSGLAGHPLEAVMTLQERSQAGPDTALGVMRLLEAKRPREHEVPVVEVLRNDHAREAEGENPPGAGAHGDPFVGRGRGDGEPRLDVDELSPPPHTALAELSVGPRHVDRRAPGFQQRAAQGEHVVGGLDVVRRRSSDALAREESQRGCLLAPVEGHVVGRAECLHEAARHPEPDAPMTAADQDERLGTFRFAERAETAGDLVHRPIPGARLERSDRAARADPVKGTRRTIGMVEALERRMAPGACLLYTSDAADEE